MFKDIHAFSSFSVNDIAKAKEFYSKILGLDVEEVPEGLQVHIAGGTEIFIYPKGSHHVPATFTVLNFPVKNIDETVDTLTSLGVEFNRYDSPYLKTDEKGICRSNGKGPTIAWFNDPAGNTVSLIEME